MTRRLTVVLGVLALLAKRPMTAQSPAEREMLSAWEDTLTRVATATTITRFEPASKAGPGGLAGDLRRALFLVRSGLLRNDRGDLELGLSNLNWVSLSRKSWPWPEYALSTVYVAMERARLPVLASGGQKEGESHVEAAWRHLREALKDDPEFESARTLATNILVGEGDREFRSDELFALRLLLKRENPESDALLAWGRQLRFQKKYDSSLVVFRRAISAGGDPSRLSLERARTLWGLGEIHNAATAYWEGVSRLTATGRQSYRYDLGWIIDPDSLPLFDKVPLDQVPGWLHRFWDERDAAAVNRPGERLEEHLKRWMFAMENYRVVVPWRHNQFGRIDYTIEGLDLCVANDSTFYRLLFREQPKYPGDLRGREPILDNRGLIFLHHGQPFRTTNGVGPSIDTGAPAIRGDPGARQEGLMADPMDALGDDNLKCPPPANPNESWLYWIDGRWRLIHFRPSCALGRFTPSTMVGYLPLSPETYLARGAFIPEYRDAGIEMLGVHLLPMACLEKVKKVIADSREDAHVAAHTDTDTPPIIRPWNSIVQMFALGHGREGNGKALLTFALSGPKMHGDSTDDGHVIYPVNFRIIAFDHSSGRTVTIDTVRRFTRLEALQRGQSIAALFEMPLGPGTWQVAVRANQGDDSSGVYAMKRDVRIDGGSELSLSDIVLGRDGSPAWLATDGANFPVNLLGAYTAGMTAELYYEVRGLRAGEAYRTTVVVRQPTTGTRDGIRIVSTDHASGAVTRVRKSLGLQQLKPGSYLMIVTVEANGRLATREQPLLIAKP